MLPKLFIGSSKEAQTAGLLDSLKSALDTGLNSKTKTITLVPWPTSAWKNMQVAVKTLLENLMDYSYGVFILSADDDLSLRGKKHYSARDNVIFEFGLFLAHLGPERTFLVGPQDDDKTILMSSVKTKKSHTVPPTNLPLRILTDLKGAYREGSYTISNPGVSPSIKFHVSGVVNAIKRVEAKLSGASPAKAQTALTECLSEARTEINKAGKGDSYYSGQFFSRFRDIATLKARATTKSVQNAVQDLLLYLECVPDLCDVSQLAREQHHSKGVSEVWVFADSPLEFRVGGRQSAATKALRNTIIENLKKGTRYVYFVGPKFEKSNIDFLVPRTARDRDKILKHIHVVKVDSQFFNTYFTLHFQKDQTEPTAIYMSSIIENQKDVLIQVSDGDHMKRIYDRIRVLCGYEEHPHSPQITRYIL